MSTTRLIIGDGCVYWECEKCGLYWEFFDYGPKENNFNYCPKCGRKVKEYIDRGKEQ